MTIKNQVRIKVLYFLLISANIFTTLFLVMDKLVKDIRLKVKESKKFWTNLPFQVCNGEDYAMAVGIEGSCWNGVNTDK